MTISTVGISSPLLATSVHTSVVHSPDLNLFNAPSLFGCQKNCIDEVGGQHLEQHKKQNKKNGNTNKFEIIRVKLYYIGKVNVLPDSFDH